jgi:hypothetical protein
MSCCGDKRSKIYHDPYRQPGMKDIEQGGAGQVATVVNFRYSGPASLTVKGEITGNIYRFDQPGATIEVDRRDASFMTGIPRLSKVR